VVRAKRTDRQFGFVSKKALFDQLNDHLEEGRVSSHSSGAHHRHPKFFREISIFSIEIE